jgi:hypothetical protein
MHLRKKSPRGLRGTSTTGSTEIARSARQVVSAGANTFDNLGIEPRPMEDWLWEITRDHRKVCGSYAFPRPLRAFPAARRPVAKYRVVLQTPCTRKLVPGCVAT